MHDRSDTYHPAATDLFGHPPRRWSTSLAVVSETYGWFLHRLGEQAARQFRLFLAELPDLQLLSLDRTHHDAVQRKLDRHRGRNSPTWMPRSWSSWSDAAFGRCGALMPT